MKKKKFEREREREKLERKREGGAPRFKSLIKKYLFVLTLH